MLDTTMTIPAISVPELTTVYWVCLIVGGGLLLISSIAGTDADAGFDADVDVDVDVDAGVDAGHAHASALASWFSIQFIVFFMAMFGLVGVTLTHLTRLMLGGMLSRGRGRILNVASTAAFQPGPLMAVYYASKAYVLSFSEALAHELRGSGVTVTALCPGPTRTGFQDRADMHDARMLRLSMMDAARVARAGYRGMQSGKVVVIPGLPNWLLAQSVRFTPRVVVRHLVGWLQASSGGK